MSNFVFKIICKWITILDDTACNLASINIAKYYDIVTKTFDTEGYLHTILMTQIVLEATIHWVNSLQKILQGSLIFLEQLDLDLLT